jgi:hypothetical protein
VSPDEDLYPTPGPPYREIMIDTASDEAGALVSWPSVSVHSGHGNGKGPEGRERHSP